MHCSTSPARYCPSAPRAPTAEAPMASALTTRPIAARRARTAAWRQLLPVRRLLCLCCKSIVRLHQSAVTCMALQVDASAEWATCNAFPCAPLLPLTPCWRSNEHALPAGPLVRLSRTETGLPPVHGDVQTHPSLTEQPSWEWSHERDGCMQSCLLKFHPKGPLLGCARTRAVNAAPLRRLGQKHTTAAACAMLRALKAAVSSPQ